MSAGPAIGVITPCLNEEPNILECHRRVRDLFETAPVLKKYRRIHLFSDNGSTDRSHMLLREVAAGDPCVRVIINSRNFGFGASIQNALRNIDADAVLVFLPADLQDPPELLPEFVSHWEKGYDVVVGIRKKREESVIMRQLRGFHYWLVKKISYVKIEVGAGEFQLISRQVLEHMRKFDDYDPYIRGMLAYCGFKRIGVPYVWKKRLKGKTTTNLIYLIHFALNGLIFFSHVPMRLCMLFGILISVGAVSWSAISLVLFLTGLAPETVRGIPLLITSFFFLTGVQFFFIGVLGEYISAIHSQVRKKPWVIEEERIGFDGA